MKTSFVLQTCMDIRCFSRSYIRQKDHVTGLFVFVLSGFRGYRWHRNTIEPVLVLEVDVGEESLILCLALVSCLSSGPPEVPVTVCYTALGAQEKHWGVEGVAHGERLTSSVRNVAEQRGR